jgi:hypothetical protein
VHAYLFERESDKARSFIDRRRTSHDGIIIFDDIPAVDFEKFLTVLYSKCVLFRCTPYRSHRVTSRSYNPVQLRTKSDWISVLSLSHLWDFAAIRAWAIRELVDITTPVDKLVLAQNYAVHEWRASAYLAICADSHWLSDEDGCRLGLEVVMKIGRARDALRTPSLLISSGRHASLIADVFGLCDNAGDRGVPTVAADEEEHRQTASSRSDCLTDMPSDEPIVESATLQSHPPPYQWQATLTHALRTPSNSRLS